MNNNAAIVNYFINLIDPMTGLTLDIEHLMATMSAEYFKEVPIIEVSVNDFAGWAGDLITVYKDVYEHKDAYDGSVYECAKDYIGTKAGYFEFDDFAADADAVNMVQKLKANRNKTIYNGFLEYFRGNEVNNRFSTFYSHRFNSDEDQIYSQAVHYLNTNDIVIATMREQLLGYYNINYRWSFEEGEELHRHLPMFY